MHRHGNMVAALASNSVTREQRRCLCVGAALEFFFFFFFFFFFLLIRADSTSTCPDLRRTGLIRPELGRVGRIGAYRPTAEIDQNDRNRP